MQNSEGARSVACILHFAFCIQMIPPFHWWRTVFFLIPAIAVYTIVLGTLSHRVQPLREQRLLRALVRAHVVAADPGDDRRARRRSTVSSGSSLAGPMSSSRIIRASTTFRSCSGRCRISCESSPRNRSATSRSSAGTCGARDTCSSIGGTRIAPGSSGGPRV